MPDLTLWGLFVVASMVLLLKPAPAVLYIVARSVEQGRAAGLVSVLGIHLDTIIHIIAAAVGLSASSCHRRLPSGAPMTPGCRASSRPLPPGSPLPVEFEIATRQACGKRIAGHNV
jgi:hypothetical protein